MRARSLPLPVLAFLVGSLASPAASAILPARADDGVVPCVAGQTAPMAPAETLPELTPPPAPAPTIADVPKETSGVAAPPRIFFSELLPDPEGDDTLGEFIEIGNAEDAEIDVTGWTITNAAGKNDTLTVSLAPKARYAFVYAETKVALTNSGTTLTLRDATGRVADTVTYPGPAKTGKAYARDADGSWKWTSSATPGDENRFDAETPAPAPTPEPPSAAQADPPAAGAEPSAAAPLPASAELRVLLTAMLPDPVGDDAAEWIEIGNDGQADAVLAGWKLDDGSGGSAPYALDAVTVPAEGRMRIPRMESKIALNNEGDEVRLIGPDGGVRQRVAYANAPEGMIYSGAEGGWSWISAGTVVSADRAATAGGAATPDEGSSPATISETRETDGEQPVPSSVGDIAPDDTALLEVDGIVTLPPGIVGKRTFAMEDSAGQAGTFVRAYGMTPMPSLAAGDRIRVMGRAAPGGGLSTVGKRIMRLGTGVLDFQERAVQDVSRDANGLALAVTGIVARRGKTSLTLTDERAGGEIAVRFARKTEVDPRIVAGATVTVKGVLRDRSGAYELIATSKDPIAPAEPPLRTATAPAERPAPPDLAADAARTEPRRPLVLGYAAEKTAPSFALGGLAAAGIAAATGLAVVVKRRRAAELDRLAADR